MIVALAYTLGVPLITEDKQILRACPDIARSMRDFLSPRPPPAVREKATAYSPKTSPKIAHKPRKRTTIRRKPLML